MLGSAHEDDDSTSRRHAGLRIPAGSALYRATPLARGAPSARRLGAQSTRERTSRFVAPDSPQTQGVGHQGGDLGGFLLVCRDTQLTARIGRAALLEQGL